MPQGVPELTETDGNIEFTINYINEHKPNSWERLDPPSNFVENTALVEGIINAERSDQKKFFNHARGKRQKYPVPSKEYLGEKTLIHSTEEAPIWTNQALRKQSENKICRLAKKTL